MAAGGEVLAQVAGEQLVEVPAGPLSFVDPVGPVGIDHQLEGAVGGDQGVDQPLRALVMHVVVATAVDHQEVAAQAVGVSQRAGRDVIAVVLLGQPHVPFLVDGVVEVHVRHRRHRHPHPIDLGRAEEHVERHRAATTPAPDPEAGGVHPVPPPDGTRRARLILGGQHPDLAIDRLAPLPAAQARRAPVVEGDHRVAPLRQHRVPRVVGPPDVHGGLAGGLAIDVEEHGVLLGGIEVGRVHHHAVKRDAVPGIDPDELDRALPEQTVAPLELGVFGQGPDDRVAGEPDQLRHRRGGDIGKGVDGVARTRRRLVVVGAGLAGGAQALGGPAAERHPVEIALGRIVRRGAEVERAAGAVHLHHVSDIVVARGDQPDVLAVAGDGVGMAPAVLLAEPEEALAAVQPGPVVHHVHPGAVPVDQDGPGLAGAGVAHEEGQGVLQPVEMLHDDFIGAGRPLHPRQVDVARVTGDREPLRRAPVGVHHPDLHRGVGGPRLGVLYRLDEAVETVGVVDQQEIPHPAGVQLPVRDPLPVGAPAEAVAQPELLLVDPVKGAVDQGGGAVLREGGDLPVLEPLHVDVMLADVGHPVSLGRELGEHQRLRPGLLAAQLTQLPAVQIQHPVVAPGVGPPDPRGVGVEQELPAILGEAEGGGAEREGVAGGHQLLAADQHRLVAGHRIDPDQVRDPGAFAALVGVVGGAVRRPAERRDVVALEEIGVVDHVEGDGAGIQHGLRGGGLRGETAGAEQREAGDEKSAVLHRGRERGGGSGGHVGREEVNRAPDGCPDCRVSRLTPREKTEPPPHGVGRGQGVGCRPDQIRRCARDTVTGRPEVG